MIRCSARVGSGAAVLLAGLLAACGAVVATWAAAAVPGAPTILSPAASEVTTERRPSVSGTGEPSHKVVISLDGVEVCHNAPVTPDGTWLCQPPADLPLGMVTLVAVQVGPSNEVSPEATVTFQVVTPEPEHEPQPEPQPPVITVPRDGFRSHDPTPTISGRHAAAGAKVLVHDRGIRVCGAAVDHDGRWTCTASAPLSWGRHVLRASQRVAGMESRLSPKVVVTLLRPAPQTDEQHTPENGQAAPPEPQDAANAAPQPMPAATSSPGRPQPTARPSAPQDDTGHDGDEGDGRHGTPLDERSGASVRTPAGPLSLRVRVPPAPIVRGQAAVLTGSIGPAGEQLRLEVRGRLTPGLRYSDVWLSPAGDCIVRTLDFSCGLTLGPGDAGQLRVVLSPDAFAAPALGRQQLSVTTGEGDTSELTSTVAVEDADAATAAKTSEASHAAELVPLLALLMLALAAHVNERRRTE